jgi:hypothetical protein
MTLRRARLTVAAALSASLLLAGCGSDDPEGEEPTDGSSQAQDAPATWPLTGLPAGDTDVELDRPVVVAKIDNTSNSAPQVGLGQADLVVEELVEGGTTRLAVFYYSEAPKEVGPVRSMRASDIGIVSPVDAVMAASGAAPPTLKRLKKADVEFHEEGAPGFQRDNGRSAPYNLMVSLEELAKSLEDDETARPDDYLPWGTAEDLPKGKKATSVDATFSGGHTTSWEYKGGKYVNDNSFAAKGDRFEPSSVLVLRVKVGDAGYRDPAGNPVPETKFEGKGQAMLFHKGRMVQGTWSKDGLDGALTLRTKAGELKVPAGRTWIELVPQNGGNVSYQ